MKVVVIGAGYAGTIAANRLSRRVPDAEITVVNPRPDFVERVRLHEQVAGTGRAATPLGEMLCEGIAHRVASVVKIGDGVVLLDDGRSLEHDYAVLAVGSTVAPLPGTIAVGTWEGARQAQARLAELAAGSVVTVVGGGLTGIETAAEVAAARPELRVDLVAPVVGSSLHPAAARRALRGLERLGVTVVEDTVERVTEDGSGRGAVALASGRTAPSDLTLWAMIGAVPDLAARSGLAVDGDGRAIVDEHLRSTSDARVFVVGDCAAVPGARAACATATPQGAHAADTLARLLAGRRPRPYSMGYAGQALSLGRHDGIVQMTRRDDRPRRLYLAGRTAATLKERVNRYAKYGARTATYGWIRGPR